MVTDFRNVAAALLELFVSPSAWSAERSDAADSISSTVSLDILDASDSPLKSDLHFISPVV